MYDLNVIDHFVVLMLENRSFDNLLGKLYEGRADFDGLSGTESNQDSKGNTHTVWNRPVEREMYLPEPDPGERWTDMNLQIFGKSAPGSGDVADMSGFAKSYEAHHGDPKNIMHYFKPEQLPALSALARSYAVCDRWFASAPCQTWPNRLFLHTGTADGHENNVYQAYYDLDTVFNRLEDRGIPWKVYHHGSPQCQALKKIYFTYFNSGNMSSFSRDAAKGELAAYSFIEPQYFPMARFPNDMHPPHNITYGDQLIAQVYNALLNSPQWNKTMLIVIFDEHGGCYDHVPPPKAVSPEDPPKGSVFKFDRYGVRIPAIVASPYIKPGTVFRAAAGAPFDHTSVIRTLFKRFGLPGSMTRRDAAAPDLGMVLNLDAPSYEGREAVMPYPDPLKDDADALARAKAAPLSDFQNGLRVLGTLGAALPDGSLDPVRRQMPGLD